MAKGCDPDDAAGNRKHASELQQKLAVVSRAAVTGLVVDFGVAEFLYRGTKNNTSLKTMQNASQNSHSSGDKHQKNTLTL